VRVAVHLLDERIELGLVEPSGERGDLLVKDPLATFELAGALLLVLRDDSAERVDVVEVRLRELRDGGVDVARHGQVDEEQKPSATPLLCFAHAIGGDEWNRACGGGDDDVRLGELRVELVERDGRPSHASANALPFLSVRVVTTNFFAFASRRCAHTSCAISPAPTTSVCLFEKSSKMLAAMSTAAEGTETCPSPIFVSVRTRFETSNAW
jgi:hypothetical protein